MSKFFHPEKWRELAPEFEAARHLQAAADVCPHGQPRHHILEALNGLHGTTRIPEAVAEMAQLVWADGEGKPDDTAPATPKTKRAPKV